MVKQKRKPQLPLHNLTKDRDSDALRIPGGTVESQTAPESGKTTAGNKPDTGQMPGKFLSAAYRFLAMASNMRQEPETLAEFVDAIKEITRCSAVGIRMHAGNDLLVYGARAGFCDGFTGIEGELPAERPLSVHKGFFTNKKMDNFLLWSFRWNDNGCGIEVQTQKSKKLSSGELLTPQQPTPLPET